MDPELKKALEELKAQVGKNVELLARIEKLEKSVEEGAKTVTAARAELDTLKAANDEREKAIRELKQQGLVQRQEASPVRDRQHAQAILGMTVRRILARSLNVEIPSQFKPEADMLARYEQDCLARASLHFNATTGSYLVPTAFMAEPVDTMEAVSALMGLVEFIPGLPAASTITLPTIVSRPTLSAAQANRANSDTAIPQSAPAFGSMTLTPREGSFLFNVDNNLLMMSAVPLGALLMRLINEANIAGMADWLLNGDGTSAYNSILGILKETNVDYIYTTGNNSFAGTTYEDFVKAKKKALQRGRGPRGRWLFAMDVEQVACSIDRTGKVPLVTPQADGSNRILGNLAINDEGMPDLSADGAGKIFGAFGDLATYMVGQVGGIQVASDSSYRFGYNQTAFRSVAVFDIVRKPVKTLIAIKTKS